MLHNNFHEIVYFIVGLMLVMMACAGYAYHVNARRAEDDPKKREYHPIGILFAPILLPLLVLSSVTLFLLRVLIYGVSIVLFVLALLLIRKSFLFAAMHKLIMRIGEPLLQVNTFLVRTMLRSLSYQQDRIKIPASQGWL